jgi:NitT/TauT family transport system substrate-binding protein
MPLKRITNIIIVVDDVELVMRRLMNAFFKRGGLLALAVLASLLLPAGLRAETRLEVGYFPILPMTQLFVMEGEGWTGEAGLELELTRFSSGPAIVQALGSGQLDVVYFGIGPAMVARA